MSEVADGVDDEALVDVSRRPDRQSAGRAASRRASWRVGNSRESQRF
jgi:hypothetical protein